EMEEVIVAALTFTYHGVAAKTALPDLMRQGITIGMIQVLAVCAIEGSNRIFKTFQWSTRWYRAPQGRRVVGS
ncbi:unnamed protein product, partial [Allacma fusca]